ncbi:prefoldin, archaeal alpha subunit/eukaryotic subunit 5 [Archaeoglobus sulfaticallidus PM70-1]|uniref:Prefoldin subunit alpha n=1 Tax=Archaeoglobus sulfaticallidus PM70-1 TaxID=387631 RepID=N0B900_9EURY|nr:prefoldin subunit alpha [Archaeoglobus sulfaticallidus]AGK60104.1 prefoldin, archaeal alpha subunit/eukaryotic subunit 5 [Archaeoglobus sulfaticallidus PM70-1]
MDKDEERIAQEAQQKLALLQQLQSEAEEIQRKIFEVDVVQAEIDRTIETLEYFEKVEDDVDALINLGSGVFAYVDIKNSKKMLVDVGAGAVIEREVSEVLDILKKRKESIQKGKDRYIQLLEGVYSQARQLQKEIAELSSQLKE